MWRTHFQGTEMLHTTDYYLEIIIKESIEIKMLENNFNKDDNCKLKSNFYFKICEFETYSWRL